MISAGLKTGALDTTAVATPKQIEPTTPVLRRDQHSTRLRIAVAPTMVSTIPVKSSSTVLTVSPVALGTVKSKMYTTTVAAIPHSIGDGIFSATSTKTPRSRKETTWRTY